MEITYLGHAGFCIETATSLIIIDPWLSRHGAFDASWFQFPQNHHMAEYVRNKLKSDKDKYIYISHDHKDHFDPEFLMSIENRDFTLVLANYEHKVVLNTLQKNNFTCKRILHLNDNEELDLKDAQLVLFMMDTELNCDSAILIKSNGKSFLNLNDCKIFERLSSIVDRWGKIDIFTAQFSGAIWHPTCYKLSKAHYEIISRKKIQAKYDAITHAINLLNPSFYLPSAGPAVFLDPMLQHINFEEINIYPNAFKLNHYLEQYYSDKKTSTQWPMTMPGDVLDADTMQFTHLSSKRLKEEEVPNYIKTYAAQYEDFFKEREIENSKVDPKEVFINLYQDLANKLKHFKVEEHSHVPPLYWQISEYPDEMYCVDFQNNTIITTNEIRDKNNFYYISAPAWTVNKVLTGQISWSDFALAFRQKLERKPDIYSTLIDGFLNLDVYQIERFCEIYEEIHAKKDRIIVEHKGKRYSILRYCPHQGGDLSCADREGLFIICPRHRWAFDIENKGKCRYNDASIDAICLDDEPVATPDIEK